MIYDFNFPLTEIDGVTPIKDDKGEPFTAKRAVIRALTFTPEKDEPGVDGTAKFERGMLARLIHDSRDEVALTVENIALIKKLVGRLYPVPIVLGIYTYIEGIPWKK